MPRAAEASFEVGDQLGRLIREKDANARLASGMGLTRTAGFRWCQERLAPIVRASFLQDESLPTGCEARHRFEILARSYRELRSDLRWAEERILDHLPLVLRRELEGDPWEPPGPEDAWVTEQLAAQADTEGRT